MKIQRNNQSCPDQQRQGVAAVEFALVAPLFFLMVFGTAEMGRALDVSEDLTAALREGGRLASMYNTGTIPPNMTTNEKILLDIKNVLKANGIDGDKVTLTLTYAEGANAGQPFDLDDLNNYLDYFRITASINYEDVSFSPLQIMQGQVLRTSLVFRLGKASIYQ